MNSSRRHPRTIFTVVKIAFEVVFVIVSSAVEVYKLYKDFKQDALIADMQIQMQKQFGDLNHTQSLLREDVNWMKNHLKRLGGLLWPLLVWKTSGSYTTFGTRMARVLRTCFEGINSLKNSFISDSSRRSVDSEQQTVSQELYSDLQLDRHEVQQIQERVSVAVKQCLPGNNLETSLCYRPQSDKAEGQLLQVSLYPLPIYPSLPTSGASLRQLSSLYGKFTGMQF